VERLAGEWKVADTTLRMPHPYPAGGGAEWIATHAPAWEAGASATFAITDASSDELIGAIGLSIEPKHAHAEVGYWIGLPHWNNGYGTEAGRAVLDFAFGPLALHRVQANHFARNPASGRVMQKLGMAYEGTQRDAVKRWDRFEDLVCYAILASEWSARR
jgi:RimJ/RimL family protein N-acetyltransferase